MQHEVIADLCRRAQAGDEQARNDAVVGYLGLARRLAKKWAAKYRVDHEDLVQAAVLGDGSSGLMRAVMLYDPDRKTAFSTYASFWVRDAIQRHLEGLGITTRRVSGIRRKVRRVEANLKARGIAITPARVVKDIRPLGVKMSEKTAEFWIQQGSGARLISLEECGHLPARFEDPVGKIHRDIQLNAITREIDTLSDSVQKALKLYFGLEGRAQSLEQIGRRLEISRSTASRLVKRGIETLRGRPSVRRFADV